MGYTWAITGPLVQQVPEKPVPKTQSKISGKNRRNMKLGRRATERITVRGSRNSGE
jgi:hypothetical protein